MYCWCPNIFKVISIKKFRFVVMLSFFQIISFTEQLRWTIFLIRNRFWPLITYRSYYLSYYICIMVHLAWRKGTLDWMTRDEGLWQKFSAQSIIRHALKYVRWNSQAYLCLFVVWIAISEYLPVENIWNLSIFIKALIKLRSS